jgi:hypothetical protein
MKHEAAANNAAIKSGRYVNITRVNFEEEVKARLTPTSPLLHRCKKQGFLGREFIPRDVQAHLTEGAPPPVLWALTGSNPFWLRRLIEYSSGFHTGSVYTDPDALTELPGERRCDMSVIAIHASPALHDFEELFGPYFPGDCDKCMAMFSKLNSTSLSAASNVFGFNSALGVVRDPFRSIYATYVLRLAAQLRFYATKIPRDIFRAVRPASLASIDCFFFFLFFFSLSWLFLTRNTGGVCAGGSLHCTGVGGRCRAVRALQERVWGG